MQVPALDDSFKAYVGLWATACVVAAGLLIANPRRYPLLRPAYWRFLLEPWKVATFAVAAIGITLVAPYTGDPTWDYYDAFFMAVLAYATAPWAVGTLYLAARGRGLVAEAYVALCIWMFSASWSYDLYLLLRDGAYPVTWYANLLASSVLYVCAGLMWSLEWRPGEGVIFAFMREGWPSPSSPAQFSKIFWTALPFMVIVGAGVLYFLLP